MQSNKLKNIMAQAIKPNRFQVMFKKVLKRLNRKQGGISKLENDQWLKSQSSDFSAYASALDEPLWKESQEVSRTLEKRAEAILKEIPYDLGGGGIYPFIYFVTRHLKPENILETGVAAGFSSYAFLSAIEANGKGTLYSSDFPYFRLPEPEKYIGIVVEPSLKTNWHLFIEGDEINLPRILNVIPTVDIFHYDSDKSFGGRRRAMNAIAGKIHPRSLILMDDIQDNAFFHDFVNDNKPEHWKVFHFQGKYVGMIGSLN